MFLKIALSSEVLQIQADVNLSYSSGRGGTFIQWTNISNMDVYYKLYQKHLDSNGEWTEWEQINTQHQETIKVLNIYPSQTDGFNGQPSAYVNVYNTHLVDFTFGEDNSVHTLPKSASLKVWMEGGTLTDNQDTKRYSAIGVDPNTGEQMIFVTPISINDFESDIKSNPNFIYDFDIIFFGSWDASCGYGIKTETVENNIREYINRGYGFIAGHDSISYDFWHKSTLIPLSLLAIRDLFGIRTSGADDVYTNPDGIKGNPVYKRIDSTQVTIQRNGLLTNYPYEIGNSNEVLNVSASHTNYHASTGDVWMSFGNTGLEIDKFGLQHNFYLTTYGNTAMIQTGHSSGEATISEMQIIANTIYYLKKQKYNNFVEDYTSQDKEPPIIDNIILDVVSETLNIVSRDIGSKYKYQVVGCQRSNDSENITSNEVEVNVLTGIKHYIYTFSTNLEATIDELTETTTSTSIPAIPGTIFHISAVDYAGNIGEIKTINIPDRPNPPIISDSYSNTEEQTLYSETKTLTYTETQTYSPTLTYTETQTYSPTETYTETKTYSPTETYTETKTYSESQIPNTETELDPCTSSISYITTLPQTQLPILSNITYSHSFVVIQSISFYESLTFNSYLSYTQFVSNFGSSLTYIHTEFIYYHYTVIVCSSLFSYYSDFFTMFEHNEGIDDDNKLNTTTISIISVVAVLIICAIIVTIVIVVRKSQNISIAEETADDIEYNMAETNQNFAQINTSNVEEDPFAQDFKENDSFINL